MTKKGLFTAQIISLFSGVVFAWFNVYKEYQYFLQFEPSIFKIKDCVVTNPVLTPCFWGATAFLVAFFWAIYIYKLKDDKKRLVNQKRLFYLLIAGTIFAWSTFSYEVYRFYQLETGQIVACTGPINSPLESSCLYGAVIFTASLVISRLGLNKIKRSESENK